MTTNTLPTLGDLRVCWIPQVPMKAFYADVASFSEAERVLSILGRYDLFQLENKIKPDFSNAGWIEYFDGTDWLGVEDEEEFNEILLEIRK